MKPNLDSIKKNKTIKELLEFGIINIDKPAGPTSFDISHYVKKKLNLPKTSHFGTLDPKVTGVLPVALSRGCKLTGFFLGEDKEYVGLMRIHEDVSLDVIRKAINEKFLGKITQLPPVKSRVKREERERTIHSFDILEKDEKNILFRTEVEGGTYIRKLISDLGDYLGIGAHMLELRRVRAGIFLEDNKEYPSVKLYDFDKAVEEYEKGNEKKLREIIIPGEIVSELFPVAQIKGDNLKQIFTGKPIHKKDLIKENKLARGEKICVFCGERFIGIYKVINGEDIFAKAEFVLQPIK
jgi:H/ACA ribonucleoprotein complex subunit 4